MKKTIILLIVFLLFLGIVAKPSLADGEIPTPTPTIEPTETPTPEIVVIEAKEEVKKNVNEPEIRINEYEWDYEVLETYARMFYGLNTRIEKHVATGICVNRYFSNARNEDGELVFGDGTLTGVVTKKGEIKCYDPQAPVTQDNLKLAKKYLDERMTAILTKQYTGFVFPSAALYFGWTDTRDIAVYSELKTEPLVVYTAE